MKEEQSKSLAPHPIPNAKQRMAGKPRKQPTQWRQGNPGAIASNKLHHHFSPVQAPIRTQLAFISEISVVDPKTEIDAHTN
jgi:hypothetical protein